MNCSDLETKITLGHGQTKWTAEITNWWKKRFGELGPWYWNEETCQEYLILASRILEETDD